MKRLVSLSLSLVVLALVGCAAETGESGAGLTIVDKAAVESQLLYIDFAVSNAPLTAEDLGDVSAATPVRIVFEDGWAVARFAPEGEALPGLENVISAWPVGAELETIDGELTPGRTAPPPTTSIPGSVVSIPGLDNRLDMAPISAPVQSIRREGARYPYAQLDWFKSRLQEYMRLPGGSHPGCL
jgi:hypothetical protein